MKALNSLQSIFILSSLSKVTKFVKQLLKVSTWTADFPPTVFEGCGERIPAPWTGGASPSRNDKESFRLFRR